MASFAADRAYAESLDAADQLAHFRDRFVRPNWDDIIYLNGNSLGPLPIRTQARIAEVIDQEWGIGLVRSWDNWIEQPRQAGEMIAEHLLGAADNDVLELTHGERSRIFSRTRRPARSRCHRHRR